MVEDLIHCCRGLNLGLFLERAWFNLSVFWACLVSASSYSDNQTQTQKTVSGLLPRLGEPWSQLKDGICLCKGSSDFLDSEPGGSFLGPVVHVGGTATELVGSWDLSHRLEWRS